MAQVQPEAGIDNPDSDPIVEAGELHEIGDFAGAREILLKLLLTDLRILDAHAHLGNHVFDSWPDKARRHYEVGVGIGDLSLGAGFNGVLEWGHIDNRPFLRCLHGLGLCLWRLGLIDEATTILNACSVSTRAITRGCDSYSLRLEPGSGGRKKAGIREVIRA